MWYKISAEGLVVHWLAYQLHWSLARIGSEPIGILTQVILGLVSNTTIMVFVLFHLYGLPVSLDLFGMLPEKVAAHTRWTPLKARVSSLRSFLLHSRSPPISLDTEEEAEEVTYLESSAEEFNLPMYSET